MKGRAGGYSLETPYHVLPSPAGPATALPACSGGLRRPQATGGPHHPTHYPAHTNEGPHDDATETTNEERRSITLDPSHRHQPAGRGAAGQQTGPTACRLCHHSLFAPLGWAALRRSGPA